MDLTIPKAVIFDWDNTLVDTWPLLMESMNNTLRHFNMAPWTLEEMKSKSHKSLRDRFPKLFGERWEEARGIYLEHYTKKSTGDAIKPLSGATETLETLISKNIPTMIVSNKRNSILQQEIEQLGWRHYFLAMVGAGDAEKDKPDPAPVRLAMQSCKVSLGRHVWFIGDSISDIECAHNTNTLPILYGDAKIDKSRFNYIHVNTHQELLLLINGQL